MVLSQCLYLNVSRPMYSRLYEQIKDVKRNNEEECGRTWYTKLIRYERSENNANAAVPPLVNLHVRIDTRTDMKKVTKRERER